MWLSRRPIQGPYAEPSWLRKLVVPIDLQHPRLHWLGPKPYAELPGCLKGFDVCLIPFVVNELTRRLSPTKTPEYLAGGKPVVSTALPDVRDQYGDIISICDNAESFAKACLM